jgi:hypothetical protein
MGIRQAWQWCGVVVGIACFGLSAERAHAQADPLSPQELVTRCFQSLADIRLPFNDSRRAGITTQTQALALCDALIDAPRLNLQSGSIQSQNPRIKLQEAKDLIRRFQQFHETYFKSDKYEHVFNEDGITRTLHDTGVPAAYFTLATFAPGPDYSRAVTEPQALEIIRGGSSTSRSGNLLRNSTPLTRYLGSEVLGTDRGLFSGIRMISSPASQVSSGGVPPANEAGTGFPTYQIRPSTLVASGWSPMWKNSLGGGFLGDPSFLLLNTGMPNGQVSNGSMVLPRRWSREVMHAAFCRNGPYLKGGSPTLTTDVSSNPSAPPFRGLSGCMQCHSTMDPLAIGIKNLRIDDMNENYPAAPPGTTASGPGSVFYPTLFRIQSGSVLPASNSLPNSFSWPVPASGVTNFHRSRVHGRLTYTSAWSGNEVTQSFDANPAVTDQLTQLGQLIRSSQDFYLCGTLRYFELLSGVKLQLESESLPELPASATAYEKKLWTDLRLLSSNFLSHRNPKEVLKQLVRTPQFISRSWGRKTPSSWVRVTSILPKSGPSTGNQNVTLSGANFGTGTTVRIGGAPCAITSRTPQEIQCTTGPRNSGLVSVDVQKGTQLDVLPNGYSYHPSDTYSSIYQNIIHTRCLGCHQAPPVNFTSYQTLMGSQVINLQNPTASKIYQRISSGDPDFRMPQGGELQPGEIASILSWIQKGAPNN